MLKTRAVLAAAATLSMVFAACGSSSDSNDLGLRDSKRLTIGSDIEYAPIEFFKEGTEVAQGVDIDLGNALAKELGVTAKFVNDTDFAGIITALDAGRFDIIMSAMSDNKERQQKVDFIDYFQAGSSILVQKGNPKGIKSVDDLCGQTVAVQKGTIQDTDILTPQVAKCQTAGRPLNVQRYEKDADALQQIKLGRVVANLEDFPVAAYNAKTSGGGADFEVVGSQIGAGPYGIAVPKDNTKLRDKLRAALQKLIDNGDYGRILEKWNVQAGAVTSAELNGGS